MAKATWELGNLVDPSRDAGRHVSTGTILVPGRVWLHGHVLRWTLSPGSREVRPTRSMLQEFVRLHELPNAASFSASVLKFANKWGVLAIDSHGRARVHLGS